MWPNHRPGPRERVQALGLLDHLVRPPSIGHLQRIARRPPWFDRGHARSSSTPHRRDRRTLHPAPRRGRRPPPLENGVPEPVDAARALGTAFQTSRRWVPPRCTSRPQEPRAIRRPGPRSSATTDFHSLTDVRTQHRSGTTRFRRPRPHQPSRGRRRIRHRRDPSGSWRFPRPSWAAIPTDVAVSRSRAQTRISGDLGDSDTVRVGEWVIAIGHLRLPSP